jgi:hypothetical protein
LIFDILTFPISDPVFPEMISAIDQVRGLRVAIKPPPSESIAEITQVPSSRYTSQLCSKIGLGPFR